MNCGISFGEIIIIIELSRVGLDVICNSTPVMDIVRQCVSSRPGHRFSNSVSTNSCYTIAWMVPRACSEPKLLTVVLACLGVICSWSWLISLLIYTFVLKPGVLSKLGLTILSLDNIMVDIVSTWSWVLICSIRAFIYGNSIF